MRSRTATANTCSTTAGRTRFERAGGDYYPEAPGRRAVQPGARPAPAAPSGCGHARRGARPARWSRPAEQLDLSSVHVTFCTEAEWQALGEAGWLQRLGMQFHWENAGYASFDDFLGALSSRKRKVLRRERRDANAAGPDLPRAARRRHHGARTGTRSTASTRSTVDRKWGSRLSDARASSRCSASGWATASC